MRYVIYSYTEQNKQAAEIEAKLLSAHNERERVEIINVQSAGEFTDAWNSLESDDEEITNVTANPNFESNIMVAFFNKTPGIRMVSGYDGGCAYYDPSSGYNFPKWDADYPLGENDNDNPTFFKFRKRGKDPNREKQDKVTKIRKLPSRKVDVSSVGLAGYHKSISAIKGRAK